jgi:hypothetical protein
MLASVPPPAPPDRYADAVRARRAELRAARTMLLGGHRAELRSGLAVGRLAACAELTAASAALARELRRHADAADRPERALLPARVRAAVDRLAAGIGSRWAASVLPEIRRVAAERGVPEAVPWPRADAPSTPDAPDRLTALLARPPTVALPAPDPPPGAVRALLAGAVGGTWRLALLPAAVLPAIGLPALGGRPAVPLALGLGAALLVAAARAHRTAADRARLRRWGVEVVAVVRGALDAELSRRLLEVERLVAAELDEAVTRRREEIDAELRALAPGEARTRAGG